MRGSRQQRKVQKNNNQSQGSSKSSIRRHARRQEEESRRALEEFKENFIRDPVTCTVQIVRRVVAAIEAWAIEMIGENYHPIKRIIRHMLEAVM